MTHGTKGWFQTSSAVLLPETRALLNGLDHRYRDSHGDKYMRKKPSGEKYTTDIGVQVDNYGEWFKTDMFFHFISEKKLPRKWDETHLPDRVVLPRQAQSPPTSRHLPRPRPISPPPAPSPPPPPPPPSYTHLPAH